MLESAPSGFTGAAVGRARGEGLAPPAGVGVGLGDPLAAGVGDGWVLAFCGMTFGVGVGLAAVFAFAGTGHK